MKLNSIAALTFYVKDLDKTAKFYESLGFKVGKREGNSMVYYVNWFKMTFVDAGNEDNAEFKKEANAEPKGSGVYINVKVDDVDEYYQGVLDAGYKPSSEPRDWPWGQREFVLRDPDGYKLVFFQKK